VSRCLRLLPLGFALLVATRGASAHDPVHGTMAPGTATVEAAQAQGKASRLPPLPPADPPAHDHASMDHASMDHASMDHSSMDHSSMDHSSIDHSSMDHSSMDHSSMDHSSMDHASMDHAQHGVPGGEPRTPVPAPTAADRAAAFPDVHGHAAHDDRVHSYWELDHLEARDADPGAALAWDARAWIGKDTQRLWLRSEGEQVDGWVHAADLEVLWGRSVSPWWDVVAGVRHDTGIGPSRTFAAVGVQGTAPYKMEVEATAYLGEGGRSAARLEAHYDTLLSNRWIVQWNAEANLLGRADPERGLGAGLATMEAGMRIRYEVTRRFAPYVGVVHEQAFGATARMRRDAGEPRDDTRVVAGVRIWF
jgi:copper resistance protein B